KQRGGWSAPVLLCCQAVAGRLCFVVFGGGSGSWKGEGLWHPRGSTPLSCGDVRFVWCLSCVSRSVLGPAADVRPAVHDGAAGRVARSGALGRPAFHLPTASVGWARTAWPAL